MAVKNTYTYNGITVDTVRALSANEKKMLEKSIDAGARIYPGSVDAQRVIALSALKAILCSENLWYRLADNAINAYREANNADESNKAAVRQVQMEGLILGMTHVNEVKHGIRRDISIAASIDRATREPDADALPGYFSQGLVLKVIHKAYASK